MVSDALCHFLKGVVVEFQQITLDATNNDCLVVALLRAATDLHRVANTKAVPASYGFDAVVCEHRAADTHAHLHALKGSLRCVVVDLVREDHDVVADGRRLLLACRNSAHNSAVVDHLRAVDHQQPFLGMQRAGSRVLRHLHALPPGCHKGELLAAQVLALSKVAVLVPLVVVDAAKLDDVLLRPIRFFSQKRKHCITPLHS